MAILSTSGIPMTSLLGKPLASDNYDFYTHWYWLCDINSPVIFDSKLLWQKNCNPQAWVYINMYIHIESGCLQTGISTFIYTCTHGCVWMHLCLPTCIHTYIQVIHFNLETYNFFKLNICKIFRFSYSEKFKISRISILVKIWKSDNPGNRKILQVW